MKRVSKLIPLLLISALILAACAQATEFSPDMKTAVANTVIAMSTKTAAAVTPATAQPTATINPLATFTSIPALPVTATPEGPQGPSLWISNWTDVSVAAGTKMTKGEAFTKKWNLTNGGTTAWDKDFQIVFVSGDSMGFTSVPLGVVVSPGESIVISLNLIAPNTVGSHTANFMLVTPDGQKFGGGANSDTPFSVQIMVEDNFAVTYAKPSAKVPSSATCPVNIILYAKITATASGDVKYHFVTSQGDSKTYTMTFTEAGTKTSDGVKFAVPSTGDLTVSIYIDSPNHQSFPAITVTSPCTP
jgi:hypothetical protein